MFYASISQSKEPSSRSNLASPIMRRQYGNGMPLPMLQRKCACGGTGGACSCDEKKKKEEGTLHRAAAGPAARTAPPIVWQALSSIGRPLDAGVRGFMEPRFGYSFGSVRVHTGPAAAESARVVNALAYTVGNSIVFGQDTYEPGTRDGRRMLAHELAHVVQQGESGRENLDKLTVSKPGDAYEQQAEAAAQAIDEGGSAGHLGLGAAVGGLVQRQKVPGTDTKFDPCITVPGLGQLCGQAAADACKKLPPNPLCSAFCKAFDCSKPPEPKTICPPGFKGTLAKGFEGQCCRISKTGEHGEEDTVDINAQNCCTPDRIPDKAFVPRCCAPGEIVSPDRKSCTQPPPLPEHPACLPDVESPLSSCICFPMTRVNTIAGTCCPVGQEAVLGKCQPAPTPPTPHPPTPVPGPIVVHFNFDRPRVGEAGAGAVGASLTADGKANLASLVALLKQNTDWKVELVGRASPEGPDTYNMDLSTRRAQLLAQALRDALSREPVAAGPDAGLTKGCQTVDSGIFACGEIGAAGPEDRQVKAILFAPGGPGGTTP